MQPLGASMQGGDYEINPTGYLRWGDAISVARQARLNNE